MINFSFSSAHYGRQAALFSWSYRWSCTESHSPMLTLSTDVLRPGGALGWWDAPATKHVGHQQPQAPSTRRLPTSHKGEPGWLSGLSVRLRLRSWSHGLWLRAPCWAVCWQFRAWSLLRILCLPLSLPHPRSCSLARSLSLSLSLSLPEIKNKTKQNKKQVQSPLPLMVPPKLATQEMSAWAPCVRESTHMFTYMA